MEFNWQLVTTAVVVACVAPQDLQADSEFAQARSYLEQNVSDGDAEVVIETGTHDGGLAALTIVAPDGRTLVEFKSPEGRLGIRSVRLESPEPENDGRVQADFPPGEYSFAGITVHGHRLTSRAALSHVPPPPVSFVHPKDAQGEVASIGLRAQWTPVAGIRKYVLILEDEAADLELKVELPVGTSSFGIPDGFMHPNTDYKLGVGTVAPDGNRSFAEIVFKTGEGR
jgi:hypothetical protein